ncbi:DUF2141 domain-containing protein [Leptothoe sp. PORK10 BA2]|uniref:DUF2141 domain-containing protein n=1 Tax=Leptothoe sp. PORK10 BA2 TaxID=3110254 RepID=UPI002B216D80|nr:DUF2141 domain-containing protein [Leptothoe sp. PORK10 BA2]MEA5466222.1 DUF2141 domain-containing protein [Leptothoe sp. PORK10 BA2]
MNKHYILTSILTMVAVGGLAYPVHGLEQSTQLLVQVSGLNELQGKVCLSLFDSSTGFPSNGDEAVGSQCVSAIEPVSTAESDAATQISPDSSSLWVAFENLAPGSYAVSVFHDANGDGEFNRHLFGMPAEGFGFSRNPEVRTGPPQFGDAVVLVAGTETKIEIELNYF